MHSTYDFSKVPSAILLLVLISLIGTRASLGAANYGKGFLNYTGCLYAYNEGGQFQMITADGDEIEEKLELSSLNYELNRMRCSNKNQAGKLALSFEMNDQSKIKSITIVMRVNPTPEYGNYWEVEQANLTVIRADIDKKRTFPLEFPDISASSEYSYSCSNLQFRTLRKRRSQDNETRADASATIQLNRFQLQPFPELPDRVFGPSQDCSKWMTMPGVMGLILVSFMTTITVIGAIFLKRIEINDFKYNKEGQMFTQSQIEASKRVQ